MQINSLIAVLLLILPCYVSAHGGLTAPTIRPTQGYEEGPIGTNTNTEDWVCRHDNTRKSSLTAVTAGGTVDLEWNFGAAHVGDCAVFLSYDTDPATTRADMKWFKIANLPDCNVDNTKTVPVTLPSWLPAGEAVLRWDWYALHVYPTVEFYVQCSDLTITSSSTTTISSIPSYVIAGQYPNRGDQAAGQYWDPYTNTKWKMEGPDCAPNIEGNCCDTTGYNRDGYMSAACRTSGTSPDDGQGDWSPQASPSTGADASDPGNECMTYTVKSGDTLTSIAANYEGVEWRDICSFNQLVDCDVIDEGEQLVIPGDACQVGGANVLSPLLTTLAAVMVGAYLRF